MREKKGPPFQAAPLQSVKIPLDSDRLFELRRTFGVYTDELALCALVFELNKALDKCKEGIVLAASDILSRLPFRSSLPCEDISAEHMLAAEFLETEPLCV